MGTSGTSSEHWIHPFSSSQISTTFRLITRADTNQINSTPRTVSLPLLLQSGCNHTIPITVSDPDGDAVRCRWAVGNECKSVCNGIPGAVLNSTTCTITYYANRGTGYKVVAVMVEDFVSGSSQPLSSVALQFLVQVVSSSQPCSRKPKFISPTPSSGSHITISPGGTFTAQLRADSGYSSLSITDIQIAGPIGIRKGALQRVSTTNDYYVTITWESNANQIGMAHHFCFVAINSARIGSDQSCILLFLKCPHPIPFSGKLSVNLHNVSLSIRFNTTVLETMVRVIFVEAKSDITVYTTGTSSSEVTFDTPTQMTVRPQYNFTDGTTYYIKFTLNCNPDETSDKTLWTFEVIGKPYI